MSVKRNSQRIFIIVIVVVFFLTSVAATGAIIFDALTRDDSNQSATQNESTNQTQQPKEGALEGTQLSDYQPVDNVDSLQVVDLKEGTGAEAKADSTITVHYTGAIASTGVVFESSHDAGQPLTIPLSDLIEGWKEGIPGMKVGGERRLLIPADKGYGAQASEKIPANSDLVFDIELVEVQ